MLRDEYRMPAEWRLLTVIVDNGSCQTFAYEIPRMRHNDFQPFAAQNGHFLAAQVETAAKSGFA
jgi:hypothetical protein